MGLFYQTCINQKKIKELHGDVLFLLSLKVEKFFSKRKNRFGRLEFIYTFQLSFGFYSFFSESTFVHAHFSVEAGQTSNFRLKLASSFIFYWTLNALLRFVFVGRFRALLPIARHMYISHNCFPLRPVQCSIFGQIEPACLPVLVGHFLGFQEWAEFLLH